MLMTPLEKKKQIYVSAAVGSDDRRLKKEICAAILIDVTETWSMASVTEKNVLCNVLKGWRGDLSPVHACFTNTAERQKEAVPHLEKKIYFFTLCVSKTSVESFCMSTGLPAGGTGTNPSPGSSEQRSSPAFKEVPSWLVSFINILYACFEQTSD